jgi:hypothetical protein
MIKGLVLFTFFIILSSCGVDKNKAALIDISRSINCNNDTMQVKFINSTSIEILELRTRTPAINFSSTLEFRNNYESDTTIFRSVGTSNEYELYLFDKRDKKGDTIITEVWNLKRDIDVKFKNVLDEIAIMEGGPNCPITGRTIYTNNQIYYIYYKYGCNSNQTDLQLVQNRLLELLATNL